MSPYRSHYYTCAKHRRTESHLFACPTCGERWAGPDLCHGIERQLLCVTEIRRLRARARTAARRAGGVLMLVERCRICGLTIVNGLDRAGDEPLHRTCLDRLGDECPGCGLPSDREHAPLSGCPVMAELESGAVSQ